MKVYLNGKLVDKDEAKISIFDHGLLYGDGVFEGIRSYNRLVFKLDEHINRLFDSAKGIDLKIPMSKERLKKAVLETLRANNLNDAYIRLVVTRGVGDLGLDPRKCKGAQQLFIITDKIVLYPEKYYKEGLEIISVLTRRDPGCIFKPQIKSLNYLLNILVKIRAIAADVEEALMINSDGSVSECTGDNIFIVKDKILLTPDMDSGILAGITRCAIIELAKKEKIPVKETKLFLDDVFSAQEAFLTGTAAEIIPVVRVDSRQIANAKPGNITLRLMKMFKELTKIDGVRY